MRIKIFTLKLNDASGGFEDAAMQEFQTDREFIEVTEHFFTCRHACGEALIERQGYRVGAVRLRGGACPRCGAKIPFVA